MKQYITGNDLIGLTEEQKYKLRYLWIPKERDLALAYVCKNAESEEFDEIVFTIGKIEYGGADENNPKNKNFYIAFRSLQLVDDQLCEEIKNIDDIVEDDELEYTPPEDYFSFEDCLPLLNIGQMIEILKNNYFGSYDFSIKYKADSGIYEIGKEAEIFINKNTKYESEELCDALWQAVKSLL